MGDRKRFASSRNTIKGSKSQSGRNQITTNKLLRFRSEAIQEVAAEQEDLRNDLQRLNAGSWVTGQAASLGGLIRGAGGIPGLVGGLIGNALQRQRQRRLEEAVKRIEQISAEKEAKIRKEWADLSYRHEFEADKLILCQIEFDG